MSDDGHEVRVLYFHIAQIDSTLSIDSTSLSIDSSKHSQLELLCRYEPANARYFQVEINCGNSMVETVKLLGCFEADNESGSNKLTHMVEGPKSEHRKFFQNIFVSDVNSEEFDSLIDSVTVPRKMVWACVVLRMLYDMAVDNYDKTRSSSSSKPPKLTSSPRDSSGSSTDAGNKVAKRVPSLNLTPIPPDPVIVHPGLATTILKLLPLLQYNGQAELSAALQWHTAEVIKSLLRYLIHSVVRLHQGI